jgi:hypothetical protein
MMMRSCSGIFLIHGNVISCTLGDKLILDILLALAVVVVTTICGLPLVWSTGTRTLTKIALSFALGYVLLSTAGIAGALVGIDPIVPQVCTALAGVFICVMFRVRNRSEAHGPGSLDFDRDDRIVLCAGALYLIIGVLFFDRLVMWMGGDAVAHAAMVRMLLEGQTLPVGLPWLESYWEYYPKGFHYYAYLWAKGFPILDVIQTVPVVITAVTPLLLYSLGREMKQDASSVYAFVLACFVFPAHCSYLIWGGYPSAAAEMLLVAAVLAAVVKRWALLALLPGILLTHTRLLALAIGVLLCWGLAERLRRHLTALHLSIIFWGLLALVAVYLSFHRPEYLVSVFSDRGLASDFVARWYPTLLALFGGAIAIVRREQLDRLALAWAGAVILIVLLADSGPLRFVGSADRLLMVLYLPLSLLAALALCRMDGGDTRMKAAFMMVLIALGSASMCTIFCSYAGAWGMPQEDYDAIMWLSGQNLSDAVCINLDETGAWVYSLTGIGVANPRMGPGASPFDRDLIPKIIADPGSLDVTGALGSFGQTRYLIYISSVSISRPGYVPPFAEYSQIYPVVNMSYPEDSYDLIYQKGAYVFGFPKGAFS